MAFSEALRSNRFGMMRSPEDDFMDEALSLAELGSFRQPIRPIRRQSGSSAGASNPMSWVTKEARQRGLPPGVENVVYNQQPEQFEKKLKIDQQLADVKGKQQESYNNRILANMENQERRLDETNRANMAKEAYNRTQEEGRQTRAELAAKAAQQRVETQQSGATGRTGMQQAGAMSRAELANKLARDLQNARSQAEMQQIMQRYYNDVAHDQQFSNQPSLAEQEQRAIGEALSENAAFNDVLYRDEKENWRVNAPAPGSSPTDPVNLLRQQLLRRIYSRGNRVAPVQPQMAPGATNVSPGQPQAAGGAPLAQSNQAGRMPAGPRRQPTNQEEASQLARAIAADYQTKKGRPIQPDELNRVMAYYMNQGGQ